MTTIFIHFSVIFETYVLLNLRENTQRKRDCRIWTVKIVWVLFTKKYVVRILDFIFKVFNYFYLYGDHFIKGVPNFCKIQSFLKFCLNVMTYYITKLVSYYTITII